MRGGPFRFRKHGGLGFVARKQAHVPKQKIARMPSRAANESAKVVGREEKSSTESFGTRSTVSGLVAPPSSAALAKAGEMRRFDAKLSDAEIETIARRIDANAKLAKSLNPKKRRLRNCDEPVTSFEVSK